MTKFKLFVSAAYVLALSSLGMKAAEVDFSYTYGAEDYEQAGTGKAEVYNVAIRITDPSLVGSKIKAFNVPMVQSEYISNISVWASKELKLEKKVNIPDITSVEATCTDGAINVTFPKMIEIPEGGLYVGYTFTVEQKTEETLKPVIVAGDPVENGLYMQTTRTYLKWKSYASTVGKSSAIKVTLDGDFYADALGIHSLEEPYATPNEEINLKALMINHGSEPLESIEYSVNNGNETMTNSITFNPAKQLFFGQTFNLELPYVVPSELNEYPLTVDILKVNGKENHDASAQDKTLLLVFNEVPVCRPLMEEYTCLGCQFCPRGFAAMEYMSKKYPDEFIAISYHNNMQVTDPMMHSSDFPQKISGNPASAINRGDIVDPYYPISSSSFGLETYWQSFREEFNPSIIKGSAIENEDGSITVNSDVTFVKSVSGSYKVAYAIIANGLTDENWRQTNYFSGENPAQYIPEMEQFCRGARVMTGLIFNDIFAAGSDFNGAKDSDIKNVVKDQIYSHSYGFGADDGISITGYDAFRNAEELYAVVILIDENGKPYNCNKFKVEGHTSGINDIESDSATVSTEYFDLNGRRVENPSNGIYIKVDTKENGAKTTSKTVIK